MRVIVSKIEKNPIVVVREKLDKVMKEEVGKKNRALFKLYTLGVLTNPVYFSERSVSKYLLQEFPDAIKYYANPTNGGLEYTPDRIALSLLMVEDDEYKDFANTLKDYLDSQLIINQLNNIYKKFVKKSLTSIEFAQRPSVSKTRVSMRCGVNFGDEVIRQVCDFGEDKTMYEYDMSKFVMYSIAKYLGISEHEYLQRASENKSFFIENITFRQECKFINLILKGSYECKGKWGELLTKKYREYYFDNYTDENTKIGFDSFEDSVYKSCFDEREELLSTFFPYEKRGWLPIYATNTAIYYVAKDTTPKSSKLHSINGKIEVGYYVYDCGNNCLLDEVNLLEGVTGEYIGADLVRKNKLKAYGKPIKLYFAGKEKEYYELSQVRKIVEEDGEEFEIELEPFVGNRTQFEYIDEEDLFKKFKATNNYEMLNRLNRSYIRNFDTMKGDAELQSAVVEMSLAYLYAQCGYTDYFSVLTNHHDVDDNELREIITRSSKLVHGLA